MSIHQYHINQFSVESEIALPCDRSIVSSSDDVLSISRARRPLPKMPFVSKLLPSGSVRFHRAENGVLLGIDGRITLFVNERGSSIEVQARDEFLEEAALYIVGSAMALCTALRGDVPLHASSVEIDGCRIALTAPCGTGKSTTTWAFLESGALFSNDDLVPLCLKNNSAQAFPSVSMCPKIGRDLMAHFQNDWSGCHEILPHSGKFWFPLSHEKRVATNAPLQAIFALQPQFEYSKRVEIVRQSGMEAIALLATNTMTGKVLESVVGTPHLMRNLAQLARCVPVFSVKYPKSFEVLPNVVQGVRETLATTQCVLSP